MKEGAVRHFEGTCFESCDEEIESLVAAMLEYGETTYTTLNGVKLVADPDLYAARPAYVEELRWSFWMAFRHRTIIADVRGDREECPNLVPELEVLRDQLIQKFNELDYANTRTVLDWFVRLMPLSWYGGILDPGQIDHVVRTLEEREEYRSRTGMSSLLVDHEQLGCNLVAHTLSLLGKFSLDENWLKHARKWLDN